MSSKHRATFNSSLLHQYFSRVIQVGKDHAYSASRSVTKPEFDGFMKLLHNIAPDAHDKLDATPHELWAYYAGRKNVCWDQVTTNPAESANSMLLEVRFSRILIIIAA